METKVRRNKFTPDEDQRLLELVGVYGESWGKISEHFLNKNVRQCRERFNNYLKPLNMNEWTPEEDRLLLEKFEEYGFNFKKITTFFQDRTIISLKNRFSKIVKKLKEAAPEAKETMKDLKKGILFHILLFYNGKKIDINEFFKNIPNYNTVYDNFKMVEPIIYTLRTIDNHNYNRLHNNILNAIDNVFFKGNVRYIGEIVFKREQLIDFIHNLKDFYELCAKVRQIQIIKDARANTLQTQHSPYYTQPIYQQLDQQLDRIQQIQSEEFKEKDDFIIDNLNP